MLKFKRIFTVKTIKNKILHKKQVSKQTRKLKSKSQKKVGLIEENLSEDLYGKKS